MLLSPSGGLIYHYRALTWGRAHWAPFRSSLHRWLMTWNPPEKHLTLVGPSGGYSLMPEFLNRFNQITCIDPDPMARLIFCCRFKIPNLDWQTRRLGPTRPIETQGVPKSSAVLFCNLLGQLHLTETPDALSEWKRLISQLTHHRSWASFHDRVSGDLPLEPTLFFENPRRLTDSEILSHFYPGHLTGELTDHETEGFIDIQLKHTYFSWPLKAGQYQLVEAVNGLCP